MKTGAETENNFSNGFGDSLKSNNYSGKKIKLLNSKLDQKNTDSNMPFPIDCNSSFKMSIKGLNRLEERSIKLRRCETEHLRACEDLDEISDESPQNLTQEQMINEISRLRKENELFRSQISSKDGSVKHKRKQLEKEENRICRIVGQSKEMEKKINEMSRSLSVSKMKKSMIKEALVKYIIKSEEQQKREKKVWVKEQKHRLGIFHDIRVGSHFKTVWEDGEEFQKLNRELQQLEEEKERIDKLRKGLKARKRQEATASGEGSDESIAKNDLEYQRKLNFKEEKEILSFKSGMAQKCMQEVREKIEALTKEKIMFQVELNRIKDEEASRRNGVFKKKYKVLKDRYLILSLLGRGGYSEIYRAYDLEN